MSCEDSYSALKAVKVIELELTPSEQKLIEAVARGEICDFGPPYQDGENATQRDLDAFVRADVIYDLCLKRCVDWPVHPKGVRLKSATIVGQLDFEFNHVLVPLILEQCTVEEPLIFSNARIASLNLSGCCIPKLEAHNLNVEGDVQLSHIQAAEGISLPAARISGNLVSVGATLGNTDGVCFDLTNAVIGINCYLARGFQASGEVRLVGANIGGNLSCPAGIFENSGGNALMADGISVKGSILLRDGFRALGKVRLVGASVGGDLSCSGGKFENPGGTALSVERMNIGGDAFFGRSFEACGQVRVSGTRIGGVLECIGGTFKNPGGEALYADGMNVLGSVCLSEGFSAFGTVRLPDISVGGTLHLSGGSFENPNDVALLGDRANVKGSVFVREGFKATGEVRLLGARVGGDLSCNGGIFENKRGDALSADGIDVKGNVFLGKEFKAFGTVRLAGANIAGSLHCVGGRFEKPEEFAIDFDGVRVNGTLFISSLAATPQGAINLGHAHVGRLMDDANSWPEKPSVLLLEGFTYDSLAPGSVVDLKFRLAWLKHAEYGTFHPQPYEQLASVLERQGHEGEARRIRVEKQRDHRKSSLLTRRRRVASWFYDVLVGYGWEPWRTVLWIFGVWIVGAAIFWWSADAFQSTVKDKSVNVPFLPIVYSVDAFVPFINLGQKANWIPDTGFPGKGWVVQIYLYFHYIIGWGLSTLAALGFSGLVRKR